MIFLTSALSLADVIMTIGTATISFAMLSRSIDRPVHVLLPLSHLAFILQASTEQRSRITSVYLEASTYAPSAFSYFATKNFPLLRESQTTNFESSSLRRDIDCASMLVWASNSGICTATNYVSMGRVRLVQGEGATGQAYQAFVRDVPHHNSHRDFFPPS